jgi:hypothetical protein
VKELSQKLTEVQEMIQGIRWLRSNYCTLKLCLWLVPHQLLIKSVPLLIKLDIPGQSGQLVLASGHTLYSWILLCWLETCYFCEKPVPHLSKCLLLKSLSHPKRSHPCHCSLSEVLATSLWHTWAASKATLMFGPIIKYNRGYLMC